MGKSRLKCCHELCPRMEACCVRIRIVLVLALWTKQVGIQKGLFGDMDALTYEEAFKRLEEAVAALQDGQMPLEHALQSYEEGMKLVHYCNELLQKAELRVQQLSVDGEGTLVVQPFELSQ
jgi:exodeoxyribonuclease VII small subunit